MSLSHSLLQFTDVDKFDTYHVGGRGSSIGEMTQAGFPVPEGFIVSATAYFTFLKENHLTTKINHLIGTINFNEPNSLIQVSSHIKKLIREGEMSESLKSDIFTAYKKLGGVIQSPVVAVRSSVTSDNLPTPQFAGQRESFLNITGESTVILKIKDSWASLFEPRAIYYRHEKKYDHFRIGLAVIVQKMIYAEKSGMLYSVNPVTHDKSSLVIEAILGLRESFEGEVLPHDLYIVDKKTSEVKEKRITDQRMMREKIGTKLHTIRVPEAKTQQAKLSVSEMKHLTDLGQKLEQHYYFPVEVEWALEKGKFFILSLRPISKLPDSTVEQAALMPTVTYQKGIPLTQGIASGHIRHINQPDDLRRILSGEIVFLKEVTREIFPHLKKAYAVVTKTDTYPADLLPLVKALGIPFVAGVSMKPGDYKDGSVLTVNGATGELTPGGLLQTKSHKKLPVANTHHHTTATKLFLSLTSTEKSDISAHLRSDGVGVLEGSHIIKELRIHPKKVIHDGEKKEYVRKLAEKIETVCREFYPRPVLYKAADLTSDEFRTLIGGKAMEPIETNPVLGYHGGFRTVHQPAVFHLELEAIRRVREMAGMTNLRLLLPYLRSTKELHHIKKLLGTHPGFRSRSFQLWMSVDTPANTVLIDAFIKEGVQGLAINMDSLAMLFSGTDPTNSEVTSLVNTEDAALLQAYHYVIKRSHKYNIPTTIYGSSLAHSPSLIENVVGWGISSITVSPDTLDNVRKTIYKYEQKLVR